MSFRSPTVEPQVIRDLEAPDCLSPMFFFILLTVRYKGNHLKKAGDVGALLKGMSHKIVFLNTKSVLF
jgi:hypothetical protein